MQKIFFLLIFLSLLFACERNGGIEPYICAKFNCKDSEITEVLKDVEAKIIKIEDIFCLTINPEDLETTSFGIGNEDILVICQDLPNEFQIENKRVIISGQKTSCSRLLTLPYLRVKFGTLFKMTAIRGK